MRCQAPTPGEDSLESLARVKPLDCEFQLDVPARNRSWYELDGYEPFSSHVFASACRDTDVVIDIGAHVGYYSLLAWSKNPRARVIAVEASPDNAQVIAQNAKLNGAANIEVIDAAFSAATGQVWFEVTDASDNCGLSGHPNSPTIDRLQVQAITGRELHIPPGRRLVIKLDVEGHELAALQGLEQLISDASEARVLMEFNPKCIRAAGAAPQATLEWMTDRGYRIFALDEGSHSWLELNPVEQDAERMVNRGYMNLMCLPTAALSVSAVLHSAALSGAEQSHVEMVEDLVARGNMVHTILPAPNQGLKERVQVAGSAVTVVEAYPWWLVADDNPDIDVSPNLPVQISSPQVLEALTKVDADLVITQTAAIPQGAICAAALGKPHVWWLREFGDVDHGLKLPLPAPELGRVILGLSDAVLTNSSAVRSHFFPDDASGVYVVPPAPRAGYIQSRKERSGQRFTIGVVGVLQPSKGQADALRAVAQLNEAGVNVGLICVGGGAPSEIERLEQLARDLGIPDRVEFPGQLRSKEEIYLPLDAVAVTSRAEAFGRVPFEATDAGVPVIYAESGGVVEYMVPEETGLAFEPGDVGGLAKAIARLADSPELAQTLAREARRQLDVRRDDPTRVDELLSALHAARDSRAIDPMRTLVGWSAFEVTRVATQRNEALVRLAEVVIQHDEALTQRDAAESTLTAIFTSRSWRWTERLRRLRNR